MDIIKYKSHWIYKYVYHVCELRFDPLQLHRKTLTASFNVSRLLKVTQPNFKPLINTKD